MRDRAVAWSHLLETLPAGYGNLTPQTPLGKITTMLYALVGIPVMYLYMANIGGILASSFKYLYSKLCRCLQPAITQNSSFPRCDPEMADLPKTATMPSIKEDTRSYLEDEVGSQGSGGKASREDSLVSGKGGRLRNMVHFTMKKKEEEGGRGEVPPGPTPLPPYSEAVKQEEEGGGPGKILRKITTKSVKKKEKEDVVEFKLVEDLRLVTIPITSCLMVLISYIVFGAVLFSTWEVRKRQTWER